MSITSIYNLLVTIKFFCDNLDNLSRRLLSQDLYIPYVAAINIWNNLLFGNLPKAESLVYHLHQTIQRCEEEFLFPNSLIIFK